MIKKMGNGKNIIFTKHAKIRMLQRKISEEEIKSAIQSPDKVEESFKGRPTIRKKFSKGVLEIVYKESPKEIITITCYWIKER